MVAVSDQTVCVKLQGRADFNLSLDWKKLIDELRLRGFRRFVLELCDCTMMDSTFLGMLSSEGLKFSDGSDPQGGALELMNPNPRIAEVLENLGVAHLFKITICPPSALPGTYEELAPTADKSKAEVTRTCLEAHRTLMSLNSDNFNKFKDVAQFLAEDLKRLELAEKK